MATFSFRGVEVLYDGFYYRFSLSGKCFECATKTMMMWIISGELDYGSDSTVAIQGRFI